MQTEKQTGKKMKHLSFIDLNSVPSSVISLSLANEIIISRIVFGEKTIQVIQSAVKGISAQCFATRAQSPKQRQHQHTFIGARDPRDRLL